MKIFERSVDEKKCDRTRFIFRENRNDARESDRFRGKKNETEKEKEKRIANLKDFITI